METQLEKDGLSADAVLDWHGRPRRAVKRPRTYWEEHVESDEWYKKKLIEDVPQDEIFAALVDSDLDQDEDEGEGECAESDGDGGEHTDASDDEFLESGEEEQSEDGDYEPPTLSDESIVSSDASSEDEDDEDGDSGDGADLRT